MDERTAHASESLNERGARACKVEAYKALAARSKDGALIERDARLLQKELPWLAGQVCLSTVQPG